MDLLFFALWKLVGIVGTIFLDIRRYFLQYKRRIISITECPVERDIFFDLQAVYRIFQRSANLFMLKSDPKQLLDIQKADRPCCQSRHLIIFHVPLQLQKI